MYRGNRYHDAASSFVAGHKKQLQKALNARQREMTEKHRKRVAVERGKLAMLRAEEKELRIALVEPQRRLARCLSNQRIAMKAVGKARAKAAQIDHQIQRELEAPETKRRAAEMMLKRLGKRVAGQTEVEQPQRSVKRVELPVVQHGKGLLEGSNPQPTIAVTSVHDVQRQLECPRYRSCTDYAAKKDWAGFHCDACSFKFEGRV